MPLNIVRQDLTKMKVDAIVNTTNEKMVGYSGVDLAVHNAAGRGLATECAKIAPLGLGTAKLTKGYNLTARYIIHTSGPVWKGGLCGESIILKSCYTESLKLAEENKFNSIAFPLISSGAYGYPKDQVLKFAISVIKDFLLDHEMTVYLCVYDRNSYEFSRELFRDISDFINEDDVFACASAPMAEAMPRLKMSMPKRMRPSAQMTSIQSSENYEDESLHDYMKRMEKTFALKLFELIDERGMTDVECYKKANVDKKTFSKIKCNPDTYKPSKQTAVAFAIALRLNLDETQELLATAGLTLSRSFTFDKIIRYFIRREIYDIFEINEALFEFDQVLLGC